MIAHLRADIAALLALAILCQGCAKQHVVHRPGPVRLPAASPAFIGTVCIDPGHPSENNGGGARQNGLTELEMNWLVATRAGELLRKANVRVVFTKRARDEFATNKQRAEIANRAHADLLLRLHCDTGAGSGITFYYPSRAGHQDGVRGPSTRVRIESQRAAKIVHDVTVAKLTGALRDNGIHGDDSTQIGRRQGALTGSIYSQVPVVLIEMVFLSNQRDARFIGSTPGREKMAQSIAAGVLTYLGTTHRTNAAPSSQ